MNLNLRLEPNFEPLPARGKKPKKSIRRSSVFVLLVTVSISAYGGFLYWQKTKVLAETARLNTSIANVEKQIKTDQSNDTTNNFVSPDLTLKALDARTEWSELILQVKTLETGEVTFDNFTVSAAGTTSISGQARSMTAIKNLLKRLSENPQVVDPFIPTIELIDKPGPGFDTIKFELRLTFVPQ